MRALLLVLVACIGVSPTEQPPEIRWPAGRDTVHPETREKGVFLTLDEWQLLWDDVRADREWHEKEKAR